MMDKLILRDYEKWKKINKGNNFSLLDYLFHVSKLDKIHSDLYFACLELFWPSFVVYKDNVYLKAKFSKKIINNLIENNEDVEFWANLILLDPYFEGDKDKAHKAKNLAKKLVNIWQAKLDKEFEDKKFKVEFVYDDNAGEYGLTFYQMSNN